MEEEELLKIAIKAKTPIALGWIDYPDKRGGIGRLLYPSGDFDKDFKEIEDFYHGFRGKHRGRLKL